MSSLSHRLFFQFSIRKDQWICSLSHLTLLVCPRCTGHSDEWLLRQVVLPVWVYVGRVERPIRESMAPFLKGSYVFSLSTSSLSI